MLCVQKCIHKYLWHDKKLKKNIKDELCYVRKNVYINIYNMMWQMIISLFHSTLNLLYFFLKKFTYSLYLFLVNVKIILILFV